MSTVAVHLALTGVSDALTTLGAALASGQSGDVWAVEAQLASAIADLQSVLAASPSSNRLDVGAAAAYDPGRPTYPPLLTSSDRSGWPEEIAADAARLREQLVQCRRLGGAVPALLSVMFPGQVGYGRDGQATLGGRP
jgi:hypothetical protein